MITRRTFCLSTSAAAGLTLAPGLAQASGWIDYAPGLVDERLAAGETVLADFFATWCSTCRRQERVMDELRQANPAYDTAITFVKVDWDSYGRGDLASRLAVPRRSTLVLLRGERELGRLVADTRRNAIAGLLDRAVA
ncbi:MAG: thioredoxin family protein [Pseudomonadota bacterium]